MDKKNDLSDQQGYRIIDIGIDNNKLVFDTIAEKDEFTKRLIFHLGIQCKIDTILIPQYEYINELSNDWDWNFPITIWGIEIHVDNRLKNNNCNDAGCWYNYYNNRGCWFPDNKDNLVLGYNNKKHKTFDPNFKDVIIGLY